MSQENLTGGVVRFEDALKHDPADQYSLSRRVAVELRFDVFEQDGGQEESIVSYVGDLARAQVNRLLRQNAVAPIVPETTATEPAAPATRKRRTAAEIAADKAAADAAKVSDPADIGGDEPAPPTDQAVALAKIAGAGTDPADVQSDVIDADPWDVAGGDTPASEITDADLTSATTKRNEELGNPSLIRGLIQSFAPEGKQIKLTDIPQSSRVEYLAKLKALAKS